MDYGISEPHKTYRHACASRAGVYTCIRFPQPLNPVVPSVSSHNLYKYFNADRVSFSQSDCIFVLSRCSYDLSLLWPSSFESWNYLHVEALLFVVDATCTSSRTNLVLVPHDGKASRWSCVKWKLVHEALQTYASIHLDSIQWQMCCFQTTRRTRYHSTRYNWFWPCILNYSCNLITH